MADITNEDRRAWAENAVDTFGRETYAGRTFAPTVAQQPKEGDDAYTMCQDLISDIMHLAAAQGWDPAEMVRRSVANYDMDLEEEREEEAWIESQKAEGEA